MYILLVMDVPWSEEDIALFRIFVNSTPDLQTALLKHADPRLVKLICDLILNILDGTVEIGNEGQKRLSKHKNILRRLISKDHKFNWMTRRKLLFSYAKKLLPALLPVFLQFLLSYLK